ncbi:hypothetical protein [Spiroplasma endosymbiont of Zeiraphera isertana]|uniref:hypothetical protein n=1 Tax=Spiroplasma endosymbiont of Zeiraphera isertana TaxID=3066313 RepID=UPI00313F2AF2
MKTKKNSQQTPLLNKNNNNYNAIKNQDQPSTSQEHVNGYHQENLEVRNKAMEWQPFLGLFFGRHLFLIINWS